MEDHFSWSDNIRAAFSSCLPCLRTSHSDTDSLVQYDDNTYGNGTRGVPRARPNELEGLLADVGDTDTEAETLSLHSNIGNGDRRRKKKKRELKKISFFGWNLFGRPPIYLPDNDGEEDELLRRRRGRRKAMTLLSSSSHSTLDSDAAPLDPAEIENLQISSAQLDERAAAVEAEDIRLKEERRQLRRERKELEKVARALALAGGAAGSRFKEGFEGFPSSGAGSNIHNITSPSQDAPPPQSPPQSGTSDGGFGSIATFFKGEPTTADADLDDADLGGQLYARQTTAGSSNGSDSRSRSSASQSNIDQSTRYNHNNLTPQQLLPLPHMVPLPHSSRSDLDPREPARKTKSSELKSKSRSSASHSSKRSSTSTSQSPSLPSPVGPSFPLSPAIVLPHSSLSLSLPREEFEGFPMDSGESLGFPSSGIGGGRGKGREMGVFLADRGNA